MPQTDYSGIAASAKLNGTLSASAGPGTVITVDTAAGWPTGATGIPFVGTFGRGTSSEEKVLFSLRSGNNLTISQRGYDDTVAADHGNGESLLHTTDATILRTASAHIYDNTRNDHPQYARVAATNAFTVVQNILLAAPGVALNARAAGSGTGAGLNIGVSGTNNVTLAAGAEFDGTTSTARSTSASQAEQTAGAFNWYSNSGLTAGSTYTRTRIAALSSSSFKVTAVNSALGTGADGATGSFVNVGHFDNAHGLVSAGGSATDVGLLLVGKGAGNITLQTGAVRTTRLDIDGTNGYWFIGNATAPGSNPSSGGYFYAEGGALKYRGSAGTVTTLAPA